jgi:hypothetical protein
MSGLIGAWPVPARRHTGRAMAQPRPVIEPPGEPAWDIAFTRLARALRPAVDAGVLDLAHRFQAIGLGCHLQHRLTPRGLSTFLAVLGPRGLRCIVDVTLVDGVAVGLGPWAALDIRLLDACGDVVAEGPADGLHVAPLSAAAAQLSRAPAALAHACTVVYVAALVHFELVPSGLVAGQSLQ